MEADSTSDVQHVYYTFYEDVYYNHLVQKEEERCNKFIYKGRSPQLSHRKCLIKDLLSLSNKLKLSPTTYHLAVHLLDIFMDHHEIDTQQLMLAASSCLLVSAKYVDVDINVPRISRLQALTNYINSSHEYRTMELMLLNFWRWDLNFATALHFLEYLMSGSILLRCTEGLATYHPHPHIYNDFKCQVLRFADMALSEADFIYFQSSKVAAACVATTRIMFQLLPTWPSSMVATTGYSYFDIDGCVQRLIAQAQCETIGFVITPVTLPVNGYESYEESLKTESKWKNKVTPNSYNSARTKRRLLVSRAGLKKMYCAI